MGKRKGKLHSWFLLDFGDPFGHQMEILPSALHKGSLHMTIYLLTIQAQKNDNQEN